VAKHRGAGSPVRRDSYRLVARIINAVSDPIFVKDARHCRVLVNDAYCRLVGRTRKELIGKSDADLYPPDQAAGFAAQDDRVLSGLEEQLMERAQLDVRGEQRILSVRKSLFVDEEGRRFVVGIARDITAHKIVEEELKLKAQLLDSATDAILLLDPDAALLYFNDALARMTGYSRQELARMRLPDFEPPEYAERISGNIARLIADGEATFDSAYLRKDGTVLPVEVHARTAEVGGRPAILSLVRDTTERKKLEAMLLQAKTEWEETFNIINEAITIHDDRFNVVRFNRAAEEILNLPALAIRRQKCHESYHGTGAPPPGCASCQVLKTGRPSLVEVYEPHLGKHLEIRALPRLDAAGALAGVVHIVRDITDRKRGEEEQRRLQAQLVQAQKMESIGRLAGGIAHDFNNVLSAILGYSELGLFKTERSDPRWEIFNVIHESGQKASALIRQLLAFSRRQVLEVRAVDLHAVIGEFVRTFKPVIGEDVILEVRLQAGRSVVLADPNQLEQVIMNLVVNARDAMPSGGRLVVETAEADAAPPATGLPPGPVLTLLVRDSGVGMAPEVRDRVFEPFFTTKEVGKGTGLGLATVYGIVKQHRGAVAVESAPGSGSTFTVYLPLAEAPAAETAEGGRPLLPPGVETVLVVDDEPTIAGLVVDVLQPLGYRVFEAHDGEEALRVAAGIPGAIDLLLTDVVMPRVNGRDLAEALRRERPGLRVVFMSGYSEDIIAHHGVVEEGINYLPKPVLPSTVAIMVRKVLDHPG
jgi:PAS domain S-box-containing protein